MKKYNNILFAISCVIILGITACTKEDPEETSASFTTNINNNSLNSGESFSVYLDDAKGEFLTYFKGNSEDNTYGNQGAAGTPVDVNVDSVVVGAYNAAGTYTFTLVARSFGNWSEDVAEDVQSISITVVE